MAKCSYIGTCPFPTDKLSNMPVTTGFMVDNYCSWDFTRCKIYRVAVERKIDTTSTGGIDEESVSSEKILNWLISGRIGW